MRSVNLQKAYDIAKEKDDKLTAYDFSPYSCVNVCHQDGSSFFYNNAFCERITVNDQEFLAVYPEHTDMQVFSVDDLNSSVLLKEKDKHV